MSLPIDQCQYQTILRYIAESMLQMPHSFGLGFFFPPKEFIAAEVTFLKRKRWFSSWLWLSPFTHNSKWVQQWCWQAPLLGWCKLQVSLTALRLSKFFFPWLLKKLIQKFTLSKLQPRGYSPPAWSEVQSFPDTPLRFKKHGCITSLAYTFTTSFDRKFLPQTY